jgi:hypothetical protein
LKNLKVSSLKKKNFLFFNHFEKFLNIPKKKKNFRFFKEEKFKVKIKFPFFSFKPKLTPFFKTNRKKKKKDSFIDQKNVSKKSCY